MHKVSLDEFIVLEGIHDPGIFKAILLVGGPSSGKTFFKSHVLRGPAEFKTVNPDVIYEYYMKKKAKARTMDQDAMTPEEKKVHDELFKKSREKVVSAQEMYIKRRLPIIIDRTGAYPEAMKKTKNQLDNLGYESLLIFVDTPLEDALKRVEKRERVPEREKIKWYHNQVRKNIDLYKNMFENFIHVDNRGPFDEKKKEEWDKLWLRVNKWIYKPVNNPAVSEWKKEHQKRDVKKP